jgi:hypothetical protein
MIEFLNTHKFHLIIISIFIIIYIIFISSNSTSNQSKEKFRNSANGREIFNGNFPDYIFATVDKWGNIRWYEANYDAWHYPARNRTPMHGVKNIRHNGGTSGIGEGIEYNTNSILFQTAGVSNNDADNSYGSGGVNNKWAVQNIQSPNIYYRQDPLYLYRWQSGADYVYKVFQYTNPKGHFLECCQNDKENRGTCIPKYYETNPGSECHKDMRAYCQTGNNITNKYCNTWYSNRENADINKIDKNNFCNAGDNFKKNLNFCTEWSKGDGYGSVDQGVLNYCKNNLSDNSICSCMQANAYYNLPEDAKGIKALVESRPICYSNECSEVGYITKSMKDLVDSCPKCLQVMNFKDIQSDKVDFNNLKQSCENKTTKVEVPIQSPVAISINKSQQPLSKPQIPLTQFQLLILKIRQLFKL